MKRVFFSYSWQIYMLYNRLVYLHQFTKSTLQCSLYRQPEYQYQPHQICALSHHPNSQTKTRRPKLNNPKCLYHKETVVMLVFKYIRSNVYKSRVFVACFGKDGEELSGAPSFLFSLLSTGKNTRLLWGKACCDTENHVKRGLQPTSWCVFV